MKHISIIIPCHNEEFGIGRVISGVPTKLLQHHGYTASVLVVDNNSTDKTAEAARRAGADVIYEKKKGKGNALLAGFNYVRDRCDYVVIIDGDDTYKLRETYRLVEPLDSGFGDVVAGSRLGGKTMAGSLSFSHRFVNWAFAFIVRHFYNTNVTDVLTGFIAMKNDVLKTLIPNLNATDFTIEMEMITKLNRLGFEMYSVPITYDKRIGDSKIESLTDGIKILFTFIRNLTWKPVKGPSKKDEIKKKFLSFFL